MNLHAPGFPPLVVCIALRGQADCLRAADQSEAAGLTYRLSPTPSAPFSSSGDSTRHKARQRPQRTDYRPDACQKKVRNLLKPTPTARQSCTPADFYAPIF